MKMYGIDLDYCDAEIERLLAMIAHRDARFDQLAAQIRPGQNLRNLELMEKLTQHMRETVIKKQTPATQSAIWQAAVKQYQEQLATA